MPLSLGNWTIIKNCNITWVSFAALLISFFLFKKVFLWSEGVRRVIIRPTLPTINHGRWCAWGRRRGGGVISRDWNILISQQRLCLRKASSEILKPAPTPTPCACAEDGRLHRVS